MFKRTAIQQAFAKFPKQRRLLAGIGIQALLPALSLYLALLLRLDLDANRINYSAYWMWASNLIWLRLLALIYFRAHTGLWRYVSIGDLLRISKATTVSTIVLTVALATLTDFEGIPRSVVLIEWGVHIFIAGGIRVLVRVGREQLKDSKTNRVPKRKAVIVGAGDAAAAFCAQVHSTPDFGIKPVAVVDDDLSKIGLSLIGVPITGTVDDLPAIVKKHKANLIVITVPSATTEQRTRIVNKCRDSKVEFRILPGTDELLEGNVSISKLRRIDVADLLGRPETHLDEMSLKQTFTGKAVLITGAAGTIGSELARRVIAFKPSTLILIDHAENSLVLLEYELRAQLTKKEYLEVDLIVRIADVTNPIAIRNITVKSPPDVILHAAAHKHVYLMEDTPADAVANNVGGVLNVARAAKECGASTFILVSTDKAVAPTSVMGATKRMAELAIRELGEDGITKFSAVRFGNVLGSNASVVPIFQQQIESGGPVTVTDPAAERYFMTAHEAAGLILMAAAIGENQEIYLLDMGIPVNIDTLARTMIELSGLVPNQDIHIDYTGLKTGEKLTEVLAWGEEELSTTDHEKLWLVRHSSQESIRLGQLDEFIDQVRTLTASEVKEGIMRIVTDYQIDTRS